MNHWIPTTRRASPSIDDHILLLQLERANEALEDRVAVLEDEDDPDRYDRDIEHIDARVSELSSDLLEMGDLLSTLSERIVEVERTNTQLLETLSRALTRWG